MKTYIKKLFHLCGLELKKYHPSISESSPPPIPPGSAKRPIGSFPFFFEDLHARGFIPTCILDVGANQGKWTRRAKKNFTDAAFLLIEPQIEMKPYLDALCQEFQDIQWIETAAGAREEELVLTIWEDHEGSSFLPEVDKSLLESGKQKKVKVMTIDSILLKHSVKIPELVKLDIQGFEIEALKGANSLFGITEVFILEVSLFRFYENMPTFREIISFMGEKGYEVYDIPGFLRRPSDGALGQVDLAFARKDGVLRQHEDVW